MDQQEQPSLGLLGILDLRLIQQISKYLITREVLSLGLTNSFFKDQLLNFKKRVESLDKMVIVENDEIELYLQVDISDIYDKIEAIMAIVKTKDQGWVTAKNSWSWVTLTLFNKPEDYLSHAVQPFEKIIHSNYMESEFVERKLTIKETMAMNNTKNEQYETILGLCRKGEFKKLGIVQKCLYQGWQCHLESGKIIIIYKD